MGCRDNEIKDKLFNEVQEMMFNEELRTILRRNLFSMDSGDVGQRLVEDMNELVVARLTVRNANAGDTPVYA